MLLRRHATPLFSASLRSVAVATPPTPPVLHTAAFGGSGPGTFGQLAFVVHCAPLTVHLPIGGQLVRSAPGIVQAAFVMLHTPPVGGHWLSFAQAAPFVLHFPALGHSAFVLHSVTLSVQRPLPHCAAEAQAAPLLLHVPFVRHCEASLQALPFFAPAPVHLPGVDAH